MVKGPALKIASPLCQECAMHFTCPLASKPHKNPLIGHLILSIFTKEETVVQ